MIPMKMTLNDISGRRKRMTCPVTRSDGKRRNLNTNNLAALIDYFQYRGKDKRELAEALFPLFSEEDLDFITEGNIVSINDATPEEWDKIIKQSQQRQQWWEEKGKYDIVDKPAHYNNEKRCGTCKEVLPKSAFAKNAAKKDGLQERCKSCRSEHYFKTDYGVVARERMLKNRYGMTTLDYEIMVDQQEGKCKICSSEEKLFVDHCHDSGKVRGLLCNTCNRSLGLLKDDVDVLLSAVEYLNNAK
jgi:hypothetical protein